jgi:uncharacterized membrane protein
MAGEQDSGRAGAGGDIAPPIPHKLSLHVGRHLRGYFFAGVLVTAPIAITLYLAWAFVHVVDDWVRPLIPARYNPETYLPFALPGLGLVVLAVALTLVGALTAGVIGRFVLRTGERALARMPVIRNVYATVKQIMETILAQRANAFREAVLVEYPRRGVWTIAFVTGETRGEMRDAAGGESVNVFVPTTPNPTSGFLLFVPRSEVVPLAMTVEEAIKMVISGGIVAPPDRRLGATAVAAGNPGDAGAANPGAAGADR